MYFALPQSAPKTAVRKVAPPAVQAKPRLAYIDTIRVILIVLVIMVHAAVTYGSVGGWFYVEPGSDGLTQGVLSLIVTQCQAFFMGTFFFISGYFIPGSLDRKGQAGFWKDRLLRLGLPFLLFSFVLAKYPLYISALRGSRFAGSFWELFTRYPLQTIDSGPTWFLFALLVFSAAYSLYRALRGKTSAVRGKLTQVPTLVVLLGFALVMAVSMLLTAQVAPIGSFIALFGFISLQMSFFPQYVLMFAAGILAYRGDWLNRMGDRQLPTWRWVAIGCMVALPVLFVGGGAASGEFAPFMSGFTWQSIALNLWVGLTCVSFTLTLILSLRARQAAPSRFARGISGSAFGVYLIHPLILIAITSSMTALAIYPLLKWVLAVGLTIPITFALAYVLRQIPGLKAIL